MLLFSMTVFLTLLTMIPDPLLPLIFKFLTKTSSALMFKTQVFNFPFNVVLTSLVRIMLFVMSNVVVNFT